MSFRASAAAAPMPKGPDTLCLPEAVAQVLCRSGGIPGKKSEQDALSVASLTKVMTALVVIEECERFSSRGQGLKAAV